MKKLWIQALAVLSAAALLCGTALAAGSSLGARAEKDAQGRDYVTVTASDGKVFLSYESAENRMQYLVTAQSDQEVPTAENLIYIDQAAASDGKVTFTIYPKEVEEDKTYYVYLSSNASTGITDRTLVAVFGLGLRPDVGDIIMGDVNGDETVDVKDAVAVLDHVAEKNILTEAAQAAADVNYDETVDVRDAVRILDFVAEKITEFTKSE